MLSFCAASAPIRVTRRCISRVVLPECGDDSSCAGASPIKRVVLQQTHGEIVPASQQGTRIQNEHWLRMRAAVARLLEGAGFEWQGRRHGNLSDVRVRACSGRSGGVSLRPVLPVRRTNPQIRDAALATNPAQQEVTSRRVVALQQIRIDFGRGASQKIVERLGSARANHLLRNRRIGKRPGGRAIEAIHAPHSQGATGGLRGTQFPVIPRQSQRRFPVFLMGLPEVTPRLQHARVVVDVRPFLKAYLRQHLAGVAGPADIDHRASQALDVPVEHDASPRHSFAGRPIDDVATADRSRSGQEAARNQATESRDFAFVPQRVAAAALPEWMRGEALPPQHIRLEHAVTLTNAENGPQEAHDIAKLGLGYRRDQRPTPLEASTALSFPTLVLSTVSSIVNLTPNSSSQPIMSLTCARLSHSGMVSGERLSVRVSLSFSKASRKICWRR